MAIAELAEGKNDSVSLLSPTILHRLAAKSVPREIAEHVLNRAATGEIVSDEAVQVLVQDSARNTRESKKAERTSFKRSAAGRKQREEQERKRKDENKKRDQEALDAAHEINKAIGPESVRLLLKHRPIMSWVWPHLEKLATTPSSVY
jgi:hypothetical protein